MGVVIFGCMFFTFIITIIFAVGFTKIIDANTNNELYWLTLVLFIIVVFGGYITIFNCTETELKSLDEFRVMTIDIDKLSQ